MAVATLALIIALAEVTAVAARPAMQSTRDSSCAEWHACRELALAAADRGEYETFHDLAWRAVQTGPRKDPSLMYLLARAQALSGRPHDALVMLLRLAEMGIASDAATNDDFNRVRQLRDWPDVEARVTAAAGAVTGAGPAPAPIPPAAKTPLPPPAPATASAPAPVPAFAPTPTLVPAPTPPALTPSPAPSFSILALAPAAQTVRFSTKQFAVGGLAYDVASRRFVLGDRLGRKLMVVDERSGHLLDLVRADSAGFLDISAVEIDAKRGDLWVATGAAADATGMLHQLQLVSGRPLRTFHIGSDLTPVTVVDLAMAPSGAVLVLDSRTPQLLALRAGGTAVERVVPLAVQAPASVAARADDGVAFVAHRDGLSRIDLRARTISPVAAPKGVSLGHLERIRWHGNALIAVDVDGDGSRHVIRFEMNARGSAITQATRLEVPAPMEGHTFVTISGDELVYLKDAATDAGGRSSSDALSNQSEAEFLVYRVALP